MPTAISATAFIGTLGINTHIDFGAYGYQNLTAVENDINYLGVKIIRDSAETATDAQTWLAVAQATGAKFDDYIAETSPAGMQTDLSYITQLAQEGILSAIEGGDEEDDAYPASLGNTLQITAQFQQQVYALGVQLGLPVINMSFGAGWTYLNNWDGDYDKVGDLSAYTNYGNAHTYPNAGQLPDDTIQRMNGLAEMAASLRRVMTTEIGWSTATFDTTTIAKYVLDAAMDGIKDGDAAMYYYGMYDDASGNWGLFNSDGTARPAATALHDLTTLLTDTGATAATFTPGSLNYSLSGTVTGDNSVLIEKSDGSYWISLWNETEAANSPHTITVNLGTVATSVTQYDPLTGTSSTKTWSNVSSIQVSVPDHPVLLKIVPSTTSGGGTTTPPVLTVPATETTTTGSTVAATGASVTDAYAASNPGSVVLDVTATTGVLAMTSGGTKLAGSGTHTMSVSGTLTQINADLASLTYTAGSSAGTDSIAVDFTDQAGLASDKSIAVAVTAPASTGPAIAMPTSESVATDSTTAITGVSVTDAFAASNPGTVVLNLGATSGLIAMTNGSGTLVAGSGTHAMSVLGTLAQINADLTTLSYTAGSSAGTDSISVDVWDQVGLEGTKSTAVTVKAPTTTTSSGPIITAPASDSVSAQSTSTVGGVSVTDAFAAINPGTLLLNLNAVTGKITMTNASGAKLAGSGTHAMTVTGTLAQINAELATLSYTAGSIGTDSISVDVWDQTGVEGTSSIAVTIVPQPRIVIASTDTNVVENVSYSIITATAGDHMIFIGGSGDSLTATGGTETVQADQGANKIITGAGNDTISFAGSGNNINAGAGTNTLNDSGTKSMIVMPGAGKGFDEIFGPVLQNGDKLDFRAALSLTAWDGSQATIGNFLHVTTSGANAVISLSNTNSGAATAIANLEGAGSLTLSGLLVHSTI